MFSRLSGRGSGTKLKAPKIACLAAVFSSGGKSGRGGKFEPLVSDAGSSINSKPSSMAFMIVSRPAMPSLVNPLAF